MTVTDACFQELRSRKRERMELQALKNQKKAELQSTNHQIDRTKNKVLNWIRCLELKQGELQIYAGSFQDWNPKAIDLKPQFIHSSVKPSERAWISSRKSVSCSKRFLFCTSNWRTSNTKTVRWTRKCRICGTNFLIIGITQKLNFLVNNIRFSIMLLIPSRISNAHGKAHRKL